MATEVRVATFPNETMARYWQGVLESEGVGSIIKPLGAGYATLGNMPFLVAHGLYVLPEHEERASEVLKGAEGGERPEQT